jgi:hypothetical protein
LLIQLFDNGFALRSVAERFFIAAGFVMGLKAAVVDVFRSGRGALSRSGQVVETGVR